MARKKVEEQKPLSLFCSVVPTTPLLSSLRIKGRLMKLTDTHAHIVWNNTEHKTENGFVVLPTPHILKREGIKGTD